MQKKAFKRNQPSVPTVIILHAQWIYVYQWSTHWWQYFTCKSHIHIDYCGWLHYIQIKHEKHKNKKCGNNEFNEAAIVLLIQKTKREKLYSYIPARIGLLICSSFWCGAGYDALYSICVLMLADSCQLCPFIVETIARKPGYQLLQTRSTPTCKFGHLILT